MASQLAGHGLSTVTTLSAPSFSHPLQCVFPQSFSTSFLLNRIDWLPHAYNHEELVFCADHLVFYADQLPPAGTDRFRDPIDLMNRLLSFAIATLCLLPTQLTADSATGRHGMVATVQPIATDAALRTFQSGGNAVDAAIAAALTLGVVDGHNSGIGGGCFILIHKPDGTLLAIDGRETAPALATRDMYVREGRVRPELSRTGALAIGVPGALQAYERALTQTGRRTLSELLLPAADIAEAGFPIDRVMARNLKGTVNDLARFPATREIFLKSNGAPYEAGEPLIQLDLAKTYREIAEHGIDWFYRGPYARKVSSWMQQNQGLISFEDFRNYQAQERSPIQSTYRGHQIVGFPSPSSGGIHVAQILNILENFQLRDLYESNPTVFTNVIAEAMKLAFADRAYWLGDADFAQVPRGLVTKEYGKELAARIQPDAVIPVSKHGTPPNWETDFFRRHTTHIATADAEGYWVAITATVNTSFGSKVVVPGTGVVLNNEMDDFSSQPGTPNAFGLIGSENNSIAPGKRPLSSMSPTIVLKDGQPVMTLGAAGGPKIITQVVLGIVRVIDLGWSLDQAVGGARWHHQWLPNRLFVENAFPDEVLSGLRERGQMAERLKHGGVMQAISRSPDGHFHGVSDPRVPGKAAGW